MAHRCGIRGLRARRRCCEKGTSVMHSKRAQVKTLTDAEHAHGSAAAHARAQTRLWAAARRLRVVRPWSCAEAGQRS